MAEQKVATSTDTAAPAAETSTVVTTTGGDFFAQNQRTIITVVAAILVASLAYFGFRYYVETQDEEAQAELFRSQFYFENDSLNRALNGAAGNPGFLQIIDNYGGTPAANLSHYYAGFIYLKQGKYAEAAEHLKAFSSSDLLVAPRAKALLGDAYMEQKQYSDAVSAYKDAADYKPNKFFTPDYLLKLALAQELNGDKQGAVASYDRILNEFGDQGASADAKKFKAMLEQQVAAE